MSLNNTKVSKAVKNPFQEYRRPEDVVEDNTLNRSDKIKILTSWKEDTEALLRAEAENMPADGSKDSPEDLLKKISDLLIKLEHIT